MATPLLAVESLTVTYRSKRQHTALTAVRDLSFAIEPGEFVGLVGESGSGKSTVAYALLRLLAGGGGVDQGKVCFDGQDLLTLPEAVLREVRWRDVSVVLQSSMNSLNPVITVRAQFRDAMRAHHQGPAPLSEALARREVERLLRLVKIDPQFADAYPHELSGGMKQRVAIALALVLGPRLVIMDEPTTGLDVVVQHEILTDLRALQKEHGFAVLLISHDLGSVLEVADRVLVAYAGRIVEDRPVGELLERPLHPYTQALLDCYADPEAQDIRITYIPGQPPNMAALPSGCAFAPRCPNADARCRSGLSPVSVPTLEGGRVACHHAFEVAPMAGSGPSPLAGAGDEAGPRARGSAATCVQAHPRDDTRREAVITVTDVSKTYRRRGHPVVALLHASLTLERGKVTALVGESGSGKSTLARMITGMERPDAGTIRFGELDITRLGRAGLRTYRRHVQMVFQDPFSALNPMNTVLYTLLRPLVNFAGLGRRDAVERAAALLSTVGLSPPEHFYEKRTGALSGGQAQRVVVAKALAAGPEVLIADEPVSMLDVSVRAGILRLLDDLRNRQGFTLLYITHDLLSARLLADDVVVLNRGEIVEQGPASQVIAHPQHEYTRLLLRSIPNPRRRRVG